MGQYGKVKMINKMPHLTLKSSGLTVLLAEQNVRFTLKLSDYGYIIDDGRICYHGPVRELISSEEVRKTCGL